jgi:hypothetical protein
LGAAFRGNDSSEQKEVEEVFPREIGGAPFVEEIKGETATDENWRVGRVVQRVYLEKPVSAVKTDIVCVITS